MRWNWACKKMKASAIGTASKAKPRAVAKFLDHPQALLVAGTIARRQEGLHPEPLAKRP